MGFFTDIRVGWYLAIRQLRRSSIWTTGLIVFVMLLTFLNLVVVTGILVGLVEGINESYRTKFTGDIIISPLSTKDYIEHSSEIQAFLGTLPQVERYSARYRNGGFAEANYRERTDVTEKPNETGVQVFGIDPVREDELTKLSEAVQEGEYLAPGDTDYVLLHKFLLDRYAFGEQPGLTPLKNVYPGTKIKVTINGATREMTVKGVINTKLGTLANAVFMIDSQARQMMGRDDLNVSQIAIRLKSGVDPAAFRDVLKNSGIAEESSVKTFIDAIPNGVADIKNTFSMLGNMISSVGLVVAMITIFIVIFVNALTRRKFIGILKGIGISGRAIEISYMIQSLFYAVSGSVIGIVVLYSLLVPLVAANPIDFPFSDGILVAPFDGTILRMGLLVAATIVAGYLPARMIVRKNTLDSILGRN